MTPDATTDDKVWAVTLTTLRQHHATVGDTVLRVAAVHWFDHEIVAALAGAKPPPPVLGEGDGHERLPLDLAMAVVESLPFVERHGEGRRRLHAHTRRVLLTRLRHTDPDFVLSASQAAAAELFRRGQAEELDDDGLVELAYLLLATDPDEGVALVYRFLDAPHITVAALDRLLVCVRELSDDQRLPGRLHDHAAVWATRVAMMNGDFPRVVSLADEALRDHGDDPDVVGVLTHALAYARWQLGRLDVARQLAGDVIDEHAGTTTGAHAATLLGDMAFAAQSWNDARQSYGLALRWLLSDDGLADADAVSLEPSAWMVSEEALPGDGGPPDSGEPTAVLVRVGDGFHDVRSIPFYADLWVRLANTDARRGRPRDAMEWAAKAKQLYAGLGDVDGTTQAERAEQQVAADYGDLARLREIAGEREMVLAWARAVDAAPTELQALLDLGEARLRLGELESARDSYQDALRLAVSMDDDHVSAVAAQSLAMVAIQARRFDEADRYLADAASVYARAGSDDEAHQLGFTVGDRWVAANDLVRAREAYEEVLSWASSTEHVDHEVAARLRLAHAAVMDHTLDEAVHQVDAALRLSPRLDPVVELDVLAWHALVLRLQRDDDRAEATERRAVERADELGVRQSLSSIWQHRGATASRRGAYADAATFFREAVRLAEESGDSEMLFGSLTDLANTLADIDRTDEALEAGERALALASSSGRPGWQAQALLALGAALVESGRTAAGIDRLLQAHQHDPDNSYVCHTLGWASVRAGDYEQAIEWSRRALDQNPADTFPYRNIGNALLATGRLDEARDAYRRAIEGRFGDEGFRRMLDELRVLKQRLPDLEGVDEIVAWIEAEQARLDATT